MQMRCTNFAWNMQVYTGKIGKSPEKEQGKRVEIDLVQQLGTGYGITTDNFFTSLSLAKELLLQGKTLTGTIRHRRREVPNSLWPSRARPEHSSEFLWTKDAMLTSFVPKKGRAVALLSSQRSDNAICGPSNDFKPKVIMDYNSTKGAVDTMDQMVREYSCARQTRRWPLAVFMNMLDVAAVNAYVLYMTKTPGFAANRSHKRRLFLRQLAEDLVGPQVARQRAVPAPNLPALGKKAVKRARCSICPRNKDTKVQKQCVICDNFVCPLHSKESKLTMCTTCS